MTILNRIIEKKHNDLIGIKKTISVQELIHQIRDRNWPRRSLADRLYTTGGFHFICEIKKASPSQGMIRPNFNVAEIAESYIEAGADAISILTDEPFFSGSAEHLRQVRALSNLPLLRKDFIIDTYQVYETRAMGADILLLIARILSAKQIQDYCSLARELGMDVLIELAAPEDLKKLPEPDTCIFLGINNRNLHTFEIDLQNSRILKEQLPAYWPVIAESGIKNSTDCRRLAQWGMRGALIGETLMRSADPKALLRQFKKETTYDLPA